MASRSRHTLAAYVIVIVIDDFRRLFTLRHCCYLDSAFMPLILRCHTALRYFAA